MVKNSVLQECHLKSTGYYLDGPQMQSQLESNHLKFRSVGKFRLLVNN